MIDPEYISRANETTVPKKVAWRVLVVLLVALFMTLISVSIVNVALPTIERDLPATHSDIQWVLSGYALTFGVVLVAAGRAGDLLGRGGLFLVGMVIFTLASVEAGLASDAGWLNGARFVQGVGSGIVSPQALGMIQQYFRGQDRARAFAVLGTTVGVSVAIGPVLGGLLIQLGGPQFGWRLTFLINVPFGILSIILGFYLFPRPLLVPLPGRLRENLALLDPVGALLLGCAVLAVLFPFVELGGSKWVWALLPVAAVLGCLWVWWERRLTRRGGSPMVDLKIFETRSFTNGNVIMTLYFLGMTSIWVLVALYVQFGVGLSALQSGTFGIPAALLSAISAQWAGGRVMRLGRRVVIGGIILAILGVVLTIAVIVAHHTSGASIWWLMASLCFIGVAQGAIVSPNQTLTLEQVPLAYAGSSGAIMQTGQRIGTSVGIAMITAITFATQQAAGWDVAVMAGFAVVGVVICLALIFAIKDLRDTRRAVVRSA